MMIYRLRYLLCISIISLVTACGGGSGSSSPATGTTGNEISSGVITGFGSVFINGRRYRTDSATISADDTPLTNVTELKVGMVAKVIADASTAIASSVSFDADVKGPLDSDLADFNAPFSVMGQMVMVDSATVIDNSLILPLSAGAIIEVSGLRQFDSSILATYIDKKDISKVNKFKVIGNAIAVDPSGKTFTIGSLTVNYSAATVNDLNGGNPAEGQLVEVKDGNLAYAAGTGSLAATKVEPFRILGDGGDNRPIFDVQIESVVTAVVTPGLQFKIPNFSVNILPGTTFRFGTSADISVGTVLQIKATENSSGELDASRITFKRNSARMEASVDVGGVDAANNRVTLLGITVQVNSDTEMEDKRDGISPFTVADIAESDHLLIRGFIGNNGIFTATGLRRESDDSRVELRGIVSNVVTDAPGSLDIFGFMVTAGPGTQFNDGTSTAADFFDALTNGLSNVEVKWDPFVSTGNEPKEMELEDQF
jgi:hypothetical protein